MSQTEVNTQQPQPSPGLADQVVMDRSYVNGEASLNIPFGVLVCRGTTDGSVILPDSGGVPAGVVMESHLYEPEIDLATDGVKPTKMLHVLRKGTIWVPVEDSVAPGDAVRVRTGGTGQKGGFLSTDPTGSDTAVLTPGFQWLTTAGAGEMALLEVDVTIPATMTQDS